MPARPRRVARRWRRSPPRPRCGRSSMSRPRRRPNRWTWRRPNEPLDAGGARRSAELPCPSPRRRLRRRPAATARRARSSRCPGADQSDAGSRHHPRRPRQARACPHGRHREPGLLARRGGQPQRVRRARPDCRSAPSRAPPTRSTASSPICSSPMLREWLDRELPGMVERLVSAEVARLSGRG